MFWANLGFLAFTFIFWFINERTSSKLSIRYRDNLITVMDSISLWIEMFIKIGCNDMVKCKGINWGVEDIFTTPDIGSKMMLLLMSNFNLLHYIFVDNFYLFSSDCVTFTNKLRRWKLISSPSISLNLDLNPRSLTSIVGITLCLATAPP